MSPRFPRGCLPEADGGFGSCEEGATCNGATCVAQGAPGAVCNYDFECAGGACQSNACVAMCLR